MKKLFILIVIFLIILASIKNEEVIVIPDKSIRFRVIANSNAEEDIYVKEKVAEDLSKNIANITTSNDIKDVRKNINKNIENIEAQVGKVLKDFDYKKDYNVDYGINYFPEKIYKGVKYKEGYYESLVITLGEGKGNNYWCVLFPPLCMIDEDTPKKDIEYKFIIKEIIEKFKSIKE